jgi:hypothetical protein
MPRYVVERNFPDGLNIPINSDGVRICGAVVSRNTEGQVTWLHSYVSSDRKQTFCIYDAPTPEAIRLAAQQSALPIDKITEVKILDPYFYH